MSEAKPGFSKRRASTQFNPMPIRSTDLVPGEYYHVYNRGADRCDIFFSRENYYREFVESGPERTVSLEHLMFD